jgi:hypothetical protein
MDFTHIDVIVMLLIADVICIVIALYGFLNMIDKTNSYYMRRWGFVYFFAGGITTAMCIGAFLDIVYTMWR